LVCNSFVTWLTAQNDCSSPCTVRGDQFKDDVSDKYTTQWEKLEMHTKCWVENMKGDFLGDETVDDCILLKLTLPHDRVQR